MAKSPSTKHPYNVKTKKKKGNEKALISTNTINNWGGVVVGSGTTSGGKGSGSLASPSNPGGN